MKGVLITSHGPMAKGLFETSQWFLGKDIPQYDYLCLDPNDEVEAFDAKMKEKIESLDFGDGVIVFADLFGGTPSNRCLQFMGDNVYLVSGINLTVVLELLGNRLSNNYDMEQLIETGKKGLVFVNTFKLADDEDFL